MRYFGNNSAGRDGGVIIADTTNNLNGYNSLFHSNVAGNNGGVMYPFRAQIVAKLQRFCMDRNSAKWRHELFIGGGWATDKKTWPTQ